MSKPASEMTMESLLREVARWRATKDNHPLREPPEAIEHDTEFHFSWLRECGLLRLLEAFEQLSIDMRAIGTMLESHKLASVCKDYADRADAALAEMKEKVRC